MKINDSIIIIDDVLSKEDFQDLQNYCSEENRFQSVAKGDYIYYVAYVPDSLNSKLTAVLQEIHRKKVNISISFIRLATSKLDTDLRIHSDNGNVGGNFKPTHGAIFYITHKPDTINGTALWKHYKYGYTCPEEFNDEDIQNNIMCDKEDATKWSLSTIIGGVENRLVTYPAKYFHSKYPRVMWGNNQKNGRIVLPIFYTLTDE